MRALVLVLALLIATPALAGCLDRTLATIGLPRDEIPAKAAAALAERDARAWAEDALLTEIGTFEHAYAPDATGNASEGVVFPPDAELGNGRAPAWAIEFYSPSKGAEMELVVYPNATVTRIDEETEEEDESGEAVREADWQTDSTDAAKALRANATWAEAEARGANAYAYALEGGRENLTWVVVMILGGEAPMIGLVNATSGAVEAVHRFDFDIDIDWDWEWGGEGGSWWGATEAEYEGTLTPLAPAAHDFLASRAGTLQLELAYESPTPGAHVTISVHGPDGAPLQGAQADEEAGAATWEGEVPYAQPVTIRLALDPPAVSATYTLTASLE